MSDSDQIFDICRNHVTLECDCEFLYAVTSTLLYYIIEAFVTRLSPRGCSHSWCHEFSFKEPIIATVVSVVMPPPTPRLTAKAYISAKIKVHAAIKAGAAVDAIATVATEIGTTG